MPNKILLSTVLLLLTNSVFAANNPQNDSLKIAIVQEWGQFNPITLNLASSEALIDFVVRKMVRRSAAGEALPDVAESIPSFNKKTLSAIWKIKPKAKWGDGIDITCADWELGWKAGLNPNVGASERTSFEKIAEIKFDEKNPKICTVKYKTAEWTFDRDLPPLIPSHLEASVYLKNSDKKEGYDQNSIYVREPTNAGLYNGPYLIKEFKLGSHFVLIPNKFFYGETPTIKNITIRHIGDTSTLRANLITRQIDMISSVGLPPDTAIQLDNEATKDNLDFKVVFRDSPIFQGLFFNNENEILKDPSVREALSLLVDKKSVVDSFFAGKLKPAETLLSPNNKAFKQKPISFNKRKADSVLEKSGWIKNAKGIREKNGRTLTLLFRTSSGIKVLETIQSYLCDQFKSSGIECLIKNQPPRVFLGETIQRGDFALGMFGMPVPPDTSLKSQLSSDAIPNEKNAWTGGNNLRINSTKIDSLLNEFDQEWDLKKRTAIMVKIESELSNMIPFVPIYHRREAAVIPKKLAGFNDSFLGTDFVVPEKWRFN